MMLATGSRPVDLVEETVAFLARPDVYRDRPERVDITETHLSWLFFAGDRVFKLKKPVAGDGFDFTTVEARRRNSESEVRANRRFAPGVYLGVVPIVRGRGGLALAGAGPAVDWLVEMRRLPPERTLDCAIARGRLPYPALRALGDRLGSCFAAATPVDVSPARYIRHFLDEAAASVDEFHDLRLAAAEDTAARVALRLRAFIVRRRGLILRRLREHRIVEGHGDLRPEHIWLGAAPTIIDCLEFRRDLRLLDPVDELAFLSLECARLGAAQAEPILFRRYALRTGDHPPAPLVAFYKALRALVRARIAARHLRDRNVRTPGKWIAQAGTYLAFAMASTEELGSPDQKGRRRVA